MAKNLCEAFTKKAAKRPRQTAIQWKAGDRWIKISYGELQNNISVLSAAISRYYRIGRGEKAAIMIGNRPEWPMVFFAIINAGAIPVPVNPQGSSREIENILADADCKIVFSENGCPSVNFRTVSVDSDEFKHTLYLFPESISPVKAKRDDDACIMYTSGTTANPKGVLLSHGNLLANMKSLYRLGFMKPGDGIVSVLPLYHTYAMVVTTVGPLVYGGRVVYPGSIRSKEVMLAIRQSRAVLFVGVPLIFEMFHKAVRGSLNKLPAPFRFLINTLAELLYAIRRKTGVNLSKYLFYNAHKVLGSSMRVCMCGGAKLGENVERDLFKFGFTVLNGYGLTETSPVLTVNPIKRPKIGSVGIPISDVDIKISGKDARGVGDVLVRGPNVMKGYYKNEQLTGQVMEDGWFNTGDIGYVDEDGYLFLTGRKNDAIALGTGLSICPDEIEELYLAESPVREMCVFDIPSPRKKDGPPVLWSIVVPDMEFFSERDITNPYYQVKSAFEKISRSVSIPERLMGFSLTVDTLPRTIMGKIKRREVKRLYLCGEIKEAFRPEGKRLTESDLEILKRPEAARVIECLKKQAEVHEITPRDSFELDLGIDLVGRSVLASELEAMLGLKIKDEDINKIFTVGELIEYIAGVIK